jgi:hypothetical protein
LRQGSIQLGMPVRKLVVLMAAVAGLAGCDVTLPPTNVTSSSATLNAQVPCAVAENALVWLELRPAGGSAWGAAGSKEGLSCAGRKSVLISRPVRGLRAGERYDFRLAAEPASTGGKVYRSTARSFSTHRFSPGLVASADHRLSALAAASLGADVVRLEFDIGTPAALLRSSVTALAERGARPLLLAGFHGRVPTEAEARNLAGWAAEFGPGGTFWAGRADGHLAVQQIEFGNETSYSHQYGDTWSDRSYKERAKLYATRFSQAAAAIALTGRDIGLLAQADDGGTGSSAWVDGMFEAVPNLGQVVDGWTVHPYGPRGRWKTKLDRLIAQTAARGAPATLPIDVTEYGISSSNGAPLSDNYGWPVNQTYAQAAAALDATVSEMLADPAIGRRLRLFMVYAAHDLRAPGSTKDREHSFGALQHNLAEKGAYSGEVRQQLAR